MSERGRLYWLNRQDKLAREWNRRNRDPFFYWGSWISGGVVVVCFVALVAHYAFR